MAHRRGQDTYVPPLIVVQSVPFRHCSEYLKFLKFTFHVLNNKTTGVGVGIGRTLPGYPSPHLVLLHMHCNLE